MLGDMKGQIFRINLDIKIIEIIPESISFCNPDLGVKLETNQEINILGRENRNLRNLRVVEHVDVMIVREDITRLIILL